MTGSVDPSVGVAAPGTTALDGAVADATVIDALRLAADVSSTAKDAPTLDAVDREPRAGSGPTIGVVVGALVSMVALCIGLRPVGDSSFLTHLATGRLILDSGIPRSDPYTFTAGGDAWTVQSWFASTIYAQIERWFGLHGIQLFTGLLAALIGAMAWRLSRPAQSLVGRVAAVTPAMVVASGYWAERPFLIGLACLAAVVLACEGALDPRWLVPVMWLWVNTHGSFPFAIAAVAAYIIGGRLDGENVDTERRTLIYVAVGTVAGALNPLGLKLLIFPLQLLGGSPLLHNIVEWKPPAFEETWQRVFLVNVAVVMLLLARRASWRLAVTAALFIPLGLFAARNIVITSVVLVPVVARSLSDVGSLDWRSRRPTLRVLLAGVAVISMMAVATAMTKPAERQGIYPVSALRWWSDNYGLDGETRLATPDVVGNYLEAAYGGEVPTFLDDRAELFTGDFVPMVLDLYRAKPGALDHLDDLGVHGVLWYSDRGLATALAQSPKWHIVYSDRAWLIAVPR